MEVEPQTVMQCAKEALKIAKHTTTLVRQAWEIREKLPLLNVKNDNPGRV